MSHSLDSPHPFASLIPDTLSIIFSYHIHQITHQHTHYTKNDILFFSQFIYSWKFAKDVKVKEFLERTRGGKVKLHYVNANNNTTLNDETFKFFRGITELRVKRSVQRMLKPEVSPLTEAAWENLRGVRILDVSHRNITDKSLKNFRGVHTLKISSCYDVTSRGFINLRGVKNLTMRYMSQITDTAFAHLSGVEHLDMERCTEITVAGISYLRGSIKSLCLRGCLRVESASLTHLRGTIRDVVLPQGIGLWNDAVVANLRGIQSLTIQGETGITVNGMRNLAGVKNLRLHGCRSLTDEHLDAIRGVNEVEMVNCIKITDAGMQALRGVHRVLLDKMRQITAEGFRQLVGLRVLHLWRCEIDRDDVFRCLHTVEELHMTSVFLRLGDGSIRHLKCLRDLSLDCRGTEFTIRMFEHLANCPLERFKVLSCDIKLRSDHELNEVCRMLLHVKEVHIHRIAGLQWRVVNERLQEMMQELSRTVATQVGHDLG